MEKQWYLSINEACSMDWNGMECKGAQGRFCGLCQKTVVDFTAMNNDEINSFFTSHPTEKICGRFYEHQLVPKAAKVARVNIFKQLANILGVFLGSVSLLMSQNKNASPKSSLKLACDTLQQQNLSVNIGQVTKLDSSKSPLYIIDGKVMESKFPLQNINPSDIENIEIQADTNVAIARYGEKGRNGVVLIYTKKKKPGAKKPTGNKTK